MSLLDCSGFEVHVAGMVDIHIISTSGEDRGLQADTDTHKSCSVYYIGDNKAFTHADYIASYR